MRLTLSRPRDVRRRGALLLPLLVAACVSSEPRAEVEFSYADFSQGAAPPAFLRVRYDDGGGAHELRGGPTLLPDAALVFPAVRTRTSGVLTVDAAIVTDQGDTLAKNRTVLPLRPDWRWGVDVFAATGTESLPCGGCVGRTASPFRTTTSRDSLYIVWGGRRISAAPVE